MLANLGEERGYNLNEVLANGGTTGHGEQGGRVQEGEKTVADRGAAVGGAAGAVVESVGASIDKIGGGAIRINLLLAPYDEGLAFFDPGWSASGVHGTCAQNGSNWLICLYWLICCIWACLSSDLRSHFFAF